MITLQRLAARYTFGLLVAIYVGSFAYIDVMFDGRITSESIVEGLNYSTQTVTTVGYGNWVPSQCRMDDPIVQRKILKMKSLSIPYMIFGVLYFTFGIGIIVNVISRLI
jgi:hypothetical protein